MRYGGIFKDKKAYTYMYVCVIIKKERFVVRFDNTYSTCYFEPDVYGCYVYSIYAIYVMYVYMYVCMHVC